MSTSSFAEWLRAASIAEVAALLFGAMMLFSFVGYLVRRLEKRWKARREEEPPAAASQEGYTVSAVLGLLALLTAFTFGLALDRYESRRQLVIAEANAIGTAYLRTQLLEEPHRTRLSNLLVGYLENRIELASERENAAPLIATNDRLLTEIWAGVVASVESMQSRGFANAFLNSFNEMIDLDVERKVARQARVPAEVFLVLILYLLVAAGVLGYVLDGMRGRISVAFLFVLFTLSIVLIVDLNRPISGNIQESQEPMIMLRQSLAAQPPAAFDQFKETQPVKNQ